MVIDPPKNGDLEMVDKSPAEGWDLSSEQWDFDQKMMLHHLDGIFYGIYHQNICAISVS